MTSPITRRNRGWLPTRAASAPSTTGLRTAFPDFRADIHWQTIEDDKVTTFKTYHGTHRGEFLGVPATGRSVAFDTLDVFQVRDGRLTDHWGIADLIGVLIQLGRLSTDTAL